MPVPEAAWRRGLSDVLAPFLLTRGWRPAGRPLRHLCRLSLGCV